MNYKDRITIEPGKRGGKPCIRGLRISVYDVLEMLAEGMSDAEIIEDYPELQTEDITACLGFAANREHNPVYAHGGMKLLLDENLSQRQTQALAGFSRPFWSERRTSACV